MFYTKLTLLYRNNNLYKEIFMSRYGLIFLIKIFMITSYGYGHVDDIIEGTYIKKIKDRGVLIVGMVKRERFPFAFLNEEKKLVGLEIDIVSKIAEVLNVDLKINRSAPSFNDLIPMVDKGIVDVAISKLSRTLERSQTVIFTSPYLVFRQALLLNRINLAKVSSNDSELISVLRNFSGKLGVIKNSSYERYAKNNFPLVEVTPFDTWEEALEALNRSELAAVYRDELEVSLYMKQNPEKNLYLRPVIIKDQKDPIAMALHASATHFAYFLNLFFVSIEFPRTSKELLETYNLQ